jgi:hypothetical protein
MHDDQSHANRRRIRLWFPSCRTIYPPCPGIPVPLGMVPTVSLPRPGKLYSLDRGGVSWSNGGVGIKERAGKLRGVIPGDEDEIPGW